LASLGAGGVARGQGKIPQFKDYSVANFYKGKNAAPVITKDDRTFRTRLREGAKEEPNFAGRYILTTWGCGAMCLMGAVIDAKTGKIYWLPHTTCCWKFGDDDFAPVEFLSNSRLIIFSGLRNESEKDNEDDSHFYEFRDGRFTFIKTVKRKTN
jgi:hypothetical protein